MEALRSLRWRLAARHARERDREASSRYLGGLPTGEKPPSYLAAPHAARRRARQILALDHTVQSPEVTAAKSKRNT